MDVALERLHFARDGRTVLDVPELALLTGTTTAVFGPNGSGKTTLLRLIAGLERPTAGSIVLSRARSSGPPPDAPKVAFAFQESVFVRGTVRRNLELALRLRGLPPVERAGRIAETARECGIELLLDRSARRLSTGEARRASLARALALRSPVTLLDEPLAGIDRATRLHLLDDLPRLLATFAGTAVLVTHDREEAFRLAEHLVVLVDGRVRAAGPKAAVYAHPPDRTTAELLGYTVVPAGGRLVGVPPGGFSAADPAAPAIGAGVQNGGSPPPFDMLVERIMDLGDHRHALGTCQGERVDLRLPEGLTTPRPGSTIRLVARRHVTIPSAL